MKSKNHCVGWSKVWGVYQSVLGVFYWCTLSSNRPLKKERLFSFSKVYPRTTFLHSFLNLEIADRLLGGFVYMRTHMHTQTNELTIQVRESQAKERLANTLRPKTVQNSNRRGKWKGWQDSGRRDENLRLQQPYRYTVQIIYKSTLALGDQNLVGKFTEQGGIHFLFCQWLYNFPIFFNNKDCSALHMPSLPFISTNIPLQVQKQWFGISLGLSPGYHWSHQWLWHCLWANYRSLQIISNMGGFHQCFSNFGGEIMNNTEEKLIKGE